MVFLTLDLERGRKRTHRLTFDGDWRQLYDDHLEVYREDAMFEYMPSDEEWLSSNKKAIVDGSKIIMNRTQFDANEINNLHNVVVIAHRKAEPKEPSYQALVEIIASGIDHTLNEYPNLFSSICYSRNTLVVTLDGRLSLVPYKEARSNYNYAVYRHLGGDDVGKDASHDQNFMKKLYEALINAWKTHLETGEMGVKIQF